MTDEELRAEFAAIRARVDGLPLIGAAIETLRHDVRTLRAAINDIARVNITAGEVEALHADVDAMQTRQLALETRIATLERTNPR
jgi:prefoldin subunit 5